MINSQPAYVSFVVVVVVLLCLGAWLRRRRIQALVAQRHQDELEARLHSNSGGGQTGLTGANAHSWMGGRGTTSVHRPAHAHLRQPHLYSPATDSKPDDYLPPYSQPMSSQPPPYAPSSSTDSPAPNLRGNHQ